MCSDCSFFFFFTYDCHSFSFPSIISHLRVSFLLNSYSSFANYPNWKDIECHNSVRNKRRPPYLLRLTELLSWVFPYN